MTRRGATGPEVYRITGAPRAHSDDLDRRINRYLASMAIRTVCVVLIFVVSGPLRWVFAAGAIFLPYVAVLFANATDRRRGGPLPTVDHRGLAAPAAGSGGAGGAVGGRGDTAPPAPVVLEGRVVTPGTPRRTPRDETRDETRDAPSDQMPPPPGDVRPKVTTEPRPGPGPA